MIIIFLVSIIAFSLFLYGLSIFREEGQLIDITAEAAKSSSVNDIGKASDMHFYDSIEVHSFYFDKIGNDIEIVRNGEGERFVKVTRYRALSFTQRCSDSTKLRSLLIYDRVAGDFQLISEYIDSFAVYAKLKASISIESDEINWKNTAEGYYNLIVFHNRLFEKNMNNTYFQSTFDNNIAPVFTFDYKEAAGKNKIVQFWTGFKLKNYGEHNQTIVLNINNKKNGLFYNSNYDSTLSFDYQIFFEEQSA